MPEVYTILWTPERLQRSDPELVKHFGPQAESGQPTEARVSAITLESELAAEIASTPDASVAPVMDTTLFLPLSGGPAGQDNPAWGISAVGAELSHFTGKDVRVA